MSSSKFKVPAPNKFVLRMTHPLNDVFFLKGLPLLNKIPLIKHIPFIGRGICRIRNIDKTPSSVNVSLAEGINFVGPNHPEFFTDWMLDKHLVGKKDLLMASWAAGSVVNGMGSFMQKFWLANNLIAQIPGSGNTEGKAYALEQALKGNTVLMHPEGMVHWTGKEISTLYSGIADIALQAANQAGASPVYIHTPTWCFRIVNETPESLMSKFYKEIEDIGYYFGYFPSRIIASEPSKQLQLDRDNLGLHLSALHNFIITTQLQALGIPIMYHREVPAMQYNQEPLAADVYVELKNNTKYVLFERQVLKAITNKVLKAVHKPLLPESATKEEIVNMFKEVKKAVQALQLPKTDSLRALVAVVDKLMGNMLKFNSAFYSNDYLSAEEIAECLQRLRTSYCKGSWTDTLHAYIPAPLTDRNCYVHWPEPIDVVEWKRTQISEGLSDDAKALTAHVSKQLKASLLQVQEYADTRGVASFKAFTINPWK